MHSVRINLVLQFIVTFIVIFIVTFIVIFIVTFIVTRDKLASISGRTSRTIQRALDSLKSKGIIERVGSNKTGYWKIKI